MYWLQAMSLNDLIICPAQLQMSAQGPVAVSSSYQLFPRDWPSAPHHRWFKFVSMALSPRLTTPSQWSFNPIPIACMIHRAQVQNEFIWAFGFSNFSFAIGLCCCSVSCYSMPRHITLDWGLHFPSTLIRLQSWSSVAWITISLTPVICRPTHWRCLQPFPWSDELLWVLLGLQTSLMLGLGFSLADLTHCHAPHLLSELVLHSTHHHQNSTAPAAASSSFDSSYYIFFCEDAHRPPLHPPYHRPSRILQHRSKTYDVSFSGCTVPLSIGHLKPDFVRISYGDNSDQIVT